MSRILSIALIGLYALTLLQAYVPHFSYWINRDYVATVLCENLDKPELQCEGKCHLEKEIHQLDHEQQEEKAISFNLMVEYFQPIVQFTFKRFISEAKEPNFHYLERTFRKYLDSVFRPPPLHTSFPIISNL